MSVSQPGKQKKKFSSFFKSLVIELDKDLYGPDNHLVEVSLNIAHCTLYTDKEAYLRTNLTDLLPALTQFLDTVMVSLCALALISFSLTKVKVVAAQMLRSAVFKYN